MSLLMASGAESTSQKERGRALRVGESRTEVPFQQRLLLARRQRHVVSASGCVQERVGLVESPVPASLKLNIEEIQIQSCSSFFFFSS